MKEKVRAPKLTVVAILAFVLALFFCLLELDLISTPIDMFLQRGSAVLGVVAKPAWTIWKWLA
jgi:hypothetical protein